MLRYSRRVAWRVPRILWGPSARLITGTTTVLTFIAFFNQRLLDFIVSAPAGVSPWVGLIPLFSLLLYGILQASYQEFQINREELQDHVSALESDLEKARGQAGKDTVPEETIAAIEQMKSEIEQLEAEKDWLRSQPGDEELKERARRLSDKLFRFAQERDKTAPPEEPIRMSGGFWDAIKESIADPKTQERTDYDNESWVQYQERYEPEVRSLLDALERRGWLDSQKRGEIESELDAIWRSPNDRIRRVAARVSAIGERLDGSTRLSNDEELLASNERLRAENSALKARLERKSAQPHDELNDAEIKRRCLEVAENMHQFLEDHALSEVDRVEWIDVDDGLGAAKADTETMRQFRKGPKKEVIGLLAELKRRGWWKQADFDLPDWEAVESLAHPRDLQIVADRLERVGYDF